MADFRTVDSSIWRQDNWFAELTTEGKLLWLWMLTSDDVREPWNLISFYAMARDTGIKTLDVIPLFWSFVDAGRIETKNSYFRVMASHLRCAACGSGLDMTKDHVTPRSWGGTSNPDNLQWLCRPCNSSKGNRHATRY